ncbi:uncharacterized protein LOC113459887 [Zonotrichia albicollis]|uniref:uncharacterized protein LOC113459887 n=1 Tax=Zonotrichia albicollis TaxID=44394 RepID=UPI003D80D007
MAAAAPAGAATDGGGGAGPPGGGGGRRRRRPRARPAAAAAASIAGHVGRARRVTWGAGRPGRGSDWPTPSPPFPPARPAAPSRVPSGAAEGEPQQQRLRWSELCSTAAAPVPPRLRVGSAAAEEGGVTRNHLALPRHRRFGRCRLRKLSALSVACSGERRKAAVRWGPRRNSPSGRVRVAAPSKCTGNSPLGASQGISPQPPQTSQGTVPQSPGSSQGISPQPPQTSQVIRPQPPQTARERPLNHLGSSQGISPSAPQNLTGIIPSLPSNHTGNQLLNPPKIIGDRPLKALRGSSPSAPSNLSGHGGSPQKVL